MNLSRSALRWMNQQHRHIPIAVASRQFNRINIPKDVSNEDRYRHGLLDRDQVQDLEYQKAVDNEFQSGVRISGYSTDGFRLNNFTFAIGPIIVFPKTVFSWNIGTIDDINSDSLCMIPMVDPKVTVLIIGVGQKQVSKDISKRILEITLREKINVEILSTEMACTQFNYLNSMGKMVAAALIPPQNVHFVDDNSFNTRSIDSKLYSIDNFSTEEVREMAQKGKKLVKFAKDPFGKWGDNEK